jgi:hypothetical protein
MLECEINIKKSLCDEDLFMASCINHALANEIFLAHTSRERSID